MAALVVLAVEQAEPARTERGTPEDAAYLERDLGYLMEFLQKLREHDLWDELADALDDDATPAMTMTTDCVMQRVAQRLRDGYWDHAWWERWLAGETGDRGEMAPPEGGTD